MNPTGGSMMESGAGEEVRVKMIRRPRRAAGQQLGLGWTGVPRVADKMGREELKEYCILLIRLLGAGTQALYVGSLREAKLRLRSGVARTMPAPIPGVEATNGADESDPA